MTYSRRALVTLILIAGSASRGRAYSISDATRDEKAVQEVLAGKRATANAAWWGFNPMNATAALQAAIRSGAAKVIVPNVGKPWIVDPIFLESNQEIDLEPGVEIQARRGEFLGKTDMLFKLVDKTSVTLNGYGAVLSMHKEDYRKVPYSIAEWRSCLGIYGGWNIKIYGITCANSGGDGIYIAGGGRLFSKDIVIKDVVADNNYRQAISVISVDGLLIEGAVLRGTEGTKPGAGIDFEPNGPTDRLSRIVMKNCVIEKNQSYGIWVYTGMLAPDSQPVQIDIEGGTVGGNGAGALFVESRKARGAMSIRSVKLGGKRSLELSKFFTVNIDSASAGGAP